MRFVFILCLLANLAYSQVRQASDVEVILTGDIILTIESIASAMKTKVPDWVRAFDEEARGYGDDPNQSSLTILRSTGRGNCVAFAKLGAWYALRAGYHCKFIAIARGKDGHAFLYATRDGVKWIVSGKARRRVNSVTDGIFQMNAFGSLIMGESEITLNNLDNHKGEIIEVNKNFSNSR